mgnify:CR=1 FL=1
MSHNLLEFAHQHRLAAIGGTAGILAGVYLYRRTSQNGAISAHWKSHYDFIVGRRSSLSLVTQYLMIIFS